MAQIEISATGVYVNHVYTPIPLTVTSGVSDKPGGTEFIFNKGTVISAQSKSESGSNTATVWLEIQEM